MQRRDLPKFLLASTAAAPLFSTQANAQTCTHPCYLQTAQENRAGVKPIDTAYPPGDVRRYGADPSGINDSTEALASAISTGYSLYFCDGIFSTSGNLSPRSHTTWFGTGTLRSLKDRNPLVIATGITDFTFSIDTDCSNNTAAVKIALIVDGSSYVTIADARHLQGSIRIAPHTKCTHITIIGNTLVSPALDNRTDAGAIVFISESSNFLIADNDIADATGAGIVIYNGSDRGIIARNRCTGCVGSGIYINSGKYLTIHGNICNRNRQSGIGLNTATAAIHGSPLFCTVTANICAENLYDGIDFNLAADGSSHSAFTTVSANVLVNNGSKKTGGTGIYLAGVNDTTITGNTMVGNHQPGIFLNNSVRCTVTGNGVSANGRGMTQGSGIGIALRGSNNAIMGNVSSNHLGGSPQAYGVRELSGNNNCVLGNSLPNNTVESLRLVGKNTTAQCNQPVTVDKMYYADIITSYVMPATNGVPNGSLWLNPSAGRLNVLEHGQWVAK